MKIIVITGSTRGIGYGLADAFLDLGCAVTVSGRTPAGVQAAVAGLSARHETARILGHPCDVTRLGQVQALWDAARARFGRVDMWVNNAGISHSRCDFWEHTPERIQSVVSTNLVGTMYGAKVALRGMLDQGFGSLYNMEGLGSDDHRVAGLTLYSTTKYALRHLTEALVAETRGTPLVVGALSPGMVLTDMLTAEREERSAAEWEATRRIFNILADRVEDVAPWLARRMLDNTRTGVRIKRLTRAKVTARFLSAPFRKRDLFAE